MLPIDVVFERELEADEGEGAKKIRRTLFSRSDLKGSVDTILSDPPLKE